MKVKDLIAKLQELEQEAEIAIWDEEYYKCWEVEIEDLDLTLREIYPSIKYIIVLTGVEIPFEE